MAFCAEHVPKFHPISVSGYHIREAGATAAQELAFTLADGFAYVELGLARGLDPARFVPGLSFFFNSHVDVLEELGKFRAARRIWERWLRERYGIDDDDARRLRFHTQTAGVSNTAQQPMNNVVRTAIEALTAVLGARSRCTPTRSTRCSRCRPSMRRARPAHPAGDRLRERGRRRGRSARRLLLGRARDR